ncbi:hypothetical protein K2173_024933 [Erythroxylum novogranatense]|uniref:Eukaryotic translation initiation factor 4G n=1 Tax=Erythroxylum novogranatense TaxID=1862640 RepID=A0AAV8UGW0_9ROSI|nr:hypothetical protein K2173_024933 [Erythroxylum novogranatense]
MSFNQFRSDNRKSGRPASFNQQRSSSGAYGKGGGGGGGGPAPSPSSSPSLSSNRSFKNSTNARGGQPRVNSPSVNFSDSTNPSATRNSQNGAHVQPPLQGGVSDAPVGIGVSHPADSPSNHRITRAVPKSPTSRPTTMNSDNPGQSAPVSSNTTGPKTPTKAPEDAAKGFAFQFGSLSPGFMNVMQIPARTNSAPPNLDEQKRDQARHETHRSAPPLATAIPKPQIPKKDVNSADQSNSGETHPVSKVKKDTQISAAQPLTQNQKPPVHSIPMAPMQMPYHQPPASVHFGGPNPQIQSHGVSAPSLQMPMHVTLPNAPQMQQPMFVQSLQPHPMQPQGIIHPGQSLGYTTPMAPQIGPQLGNLGIGITSQYPQQQGGKYGGPRKTPTVKITDPKTHEELRLDKRTDTYGDSASSGLRSHSNLPPHSQPISSFAHSHPVNYYANSYNASNLFYPPPSSQSISTNQMPPNSQPPRFNYPVSQGPQTLTNPSLNSKSGNKSGALTHGASDSANTEHARDVHSSFSSISSGTVQVTVRPAAGFVLDKVAEPKSSNSSSAPEKDVSHKLPQPYGGSISCPQKDAETFSEPTKPGSETLLSKLPLSTKQSLENIDSMISNSILSASTVQSDDLLPDMHNAGDRKRETVIMSNSIKDQKKTDEKGYNSYQHQVQVIGQSTSISSQPSHNYKHGISSDSGGSETVEMRTTPSGVICQGLTEPIRESVSVVSDSTHGVSDALISTSNNAEDHFTGTPSQTSGVGGIVSCPNSDLRDKIDDSSPLEQSPHEASLIGRQRQIELSEGSNLGDISVGFGLAQRMLRSADAVKQMEEEPASTDSAVGNEVQSLEIGKDGLGEPVSCHVENDRGLDKVDVATSLDSDSRHARKPLDNQTLISDVSSSKIDIIGSEEVSVTKSNVDRHGDSVPSPKITESTSAHDQGGVENTVGGSASHAVSFKDKPIERTRSKSTNSKVRWREILQKADAAGTTSDLYMAYKGPEEKKENTISTEVAVNTSTASVPADSLQVKSAINAKDQNKVEPDDWEDAADMSTPKLETLEIADDDHGGLMQTEKDGNANSVKKYSRDFLLKFAEQCVDFPEGFEIKSDIAEALISGNVDCDSHPSPGRAMDKSNSGARMDQRVGSMLDDDRWKKPAGPFGTGRGLHLDVPYGASVGFRPGQGGNFGVPRNPRAQSPVPYMGGILNGPMQSISSQGGMQRNGPDADRWQRASNVMQRGLIPSPQTPLQTMHKAEKKYEVGKVTDGEQAKQRQLKSILNKLTPQNFETLFEQVKAVNIDNESTLTGVIDQIFDKALMEPTFCELYANFCCELAVELPDFRKDNEKITFKGLLLNKCQEEFERGDREQEEANRADEEGEIKQSAEEREEKRIKARRRMLGNIRLIGELYKKKMLTDRIMHECINKLLSQYQDPDEEDVEALCKLMSTIGDMIDRPKAKDHMNAYFERITMMSNNMKLSSRVRFMLKDAIDLRKNNWKQRRKVEGPKKIKEVHRDAAQERQQQASRLARNPSTNASTRRVPMDLVTRGSNMLSSPNAQMGGFRAVPTQAPGFGTQDIRVEERQAYESRALQIPLRQRGDDSITLGPQGGLARGMSIRGPPAMVSTNIADFSSGPGDFKRTSAGLNGFSNVSERPMYNSREDPIPRHVPDRFSGGAAHDHLGSQDRSLIHGNRDVRNINHGFDRPLATSPPARAQGPASTQNISSEKVWPEERLREMSMAAIKEYYSARNDKEVLFCIKDLNSPSFYPSMVSLWMNDSFERKDLERDLLAKLLVKLTLSHDGVLTSLQLTKGFESVLSTLEDAVNDAPKAAEYLGRIFARTIIEKVVSLEKVGQLLYEGGEEPGRLLEVGLAGDVLGSTLDAIKAEKGECVLNEIRNASSLRLEDFRPPDSYRSRMLEHYI